MQETDLETDTAWSEGLEPVADAGLAIIKLLTGRHKEVLRGFGDVRILGSLWRAM